MNMEALKKIGILGITLGLAASPLAFAVEESGTDTGGNDPAMTSDDKDMGTQNGTTDSSTTDMGTQDGTSGMNAQDDNEDEWEEGGGEEEGPEQN